MVFKVEKVCLFILVFLIVSLTARHLFAGFIDFENGVDGMPIRSTIPGLEFTTTDGYDWIYGDWRTGNYCGPYPYNPNPFSCNELYYSHGNFFAWLGDKQGRGIISFTASYATYFQIGYSAHYGLYLEAYDSEGNLLDSAYGPKNTDTGRLDFLRVEGPGMAYVIVHDTGDYWLIDDLETDAIQQCIKDEHCDDGLFCNGKETCVNYLCNQGVNPCKPDEICNEEKDICEKPEDGTPEDEDGVTDGDIEEEGVGVKSVGGCGC